jgi:disulfide bond formation protein DsbB
MAIIHGISRWAEQKSSWLVLFLSALSLVSAALYFQHVDGLKPCIMCIYQRVAVIGIMLAGLIPLLVNHGLTRLIGFALWAVSAGWGWLLASEHIEIIFDDSFFASCEFVPNFPTWAPLHEWFPSVFGAPGDCMENSWQFMAMGMAEWMQIIFAIYFAIFIIVFGCRLIDKKPF